RAQRAETGRFHVLPPVLVEVIPTELVRYHVEREAGLAAAHASDAIGRHVVNFAEQRATKTGFEVEQHEVRVVDVRGPFSATIVEAGDRAHGSEHPSHP